MKESDIFLQDIQDQINHCKRTLPGFDENQISDGYHTREELYTFRKLYNAVLFNEWANDWTEALKKSLDTGNVVADTKPKYNVHKSWKHYDGEDCFGGGWFIVVAVLPTGQITNHYKAEDWDMFKIPDYPKASYEWDGHTAKDVIDRLTALTK